MSEPIDGPVMMRHLFSIVEAQERMAAALERIVALMEPHVEAEAAGEYVGRKRREQTATIVTDDAPASAPMSDATADTMPPPPPPRRLGLVVDNEGRNNGMNADQARARTSGSSHGISNLLFYTVAPVMVRLLLRDDRSIRHGLLTTTLDAEADVRPERRTRVLERLRAEEGFVETIVRKGAPGVVRVTDEARARAWLAALSPRAEER